MESMTSLWCEEALEAVITDNQEAYISRMKWALQAYENEKCVETHTMCVATLVAFIHTAKQPLTTALWVLEELVDERNSSGKRPAPIYDIVGLTLHLLKGCAGYVPATYMERMGTVMAKITV